MPTSYRAHHLTIDRKERDADMRDQLDAYYEEREVSAQVAAAHDDALAHDAHDPLLCGIRYGYSSCAYDEAERRMMGKLRREG